MELHVDDDGFVRAPRGLVYRRLTDLTAWPSFWPGLRVTRLAGQPGSGDETFRLQLRTSPLRPTLTCTVRPHAWRHDQGFHLELQGDLVGRGEFWLEEGWGGTVVHHLASLEAGTRRPRRVAAAYRAAIRDGLCGLKDDLQAEVRERLGMTP